MHACTDQTDVVVALWRASFSEPRHEKTAGIRRLLATTNKKMAALAGQVALSSDYESSRQKR